jgi:xylulokinase
MEGVAFTLAEARECLEGAGDSIGRVGLIGGGASSALWTRMIAAALNREVTRYRGGETWGAIGAARLARLAATDESPESICQAPPTIDVTEPDPALAAAFAGVRERFASLYRALKPEFSKAAAAAEREIASAVASDRDASRAAEGERPLGDRSLRPSLLRRRRGRRR